MPRSPDPELRSASPSSLSSLDEGWGEKPPPPPSARPSDPREPPGWVEQEDFLFHLYRGGELLQDGRASEAREELEFALAMQPADPKVQDLLGAVYFRLGMHAAAIDIYERLNTHFGSDASLKTNLAVCYLRAGRAADARAILREAVEINPEHKRAWGYLGLALQSLGDLAEAQLAFEHGGHAMMAKRMSDRRRRAFLPTQSPEAVIREGGVREVAAITFAELDLGELRFALAEPASPRRPEGRWHLLELGSVAPVLEPVSRP